MANEISVTTKLSMNKDGVNTTAECSFSLSPTGSQRSLTVQTIATTDTEIAFAADLITEGVSYIHLKNLDATNYVDIKIKSGGTTYTFARIKPGKSALIPSAVTPTMAQNLWAAASTAPIKLQVHAVGTVS